MRRRWDRPGIGPGGERSCRLGAVRWRWWPVVLLLLLLAGCWCGGKGGEPQAPVGETESSQEHPSPPAVEATPPPAADRGRRTTPEPFFPTAGPQSEPCRQDPAQSGDAGVKQGARTADIVFEEPVPASPEPPEEGAQSVQEETSQGRPRVAIVIDDMGYHPAVGRALLALDLNLSFSFLPHAPFTLELEQLAYEQGRDVLVHLPMEPRDSQWDPGPGALLLSMDADRLRAVLQEDLRAVPHAIGANNHMGSRFTEDATAMRRVLTVLAAEGFFFLDSFTTPRSQGLREARRLGVPAGRRHVFLDNVHDSSRVCVQLRRLVAKARRQGAAIGIGHPNQATLDSLRRCRKELLEAVELVGVHELVR